MKKLLTAAVAASVLFVSTPSAANALEGKSCKKSGAIRRFPDRWLVCAKRNGKLRWFVAIQFTTTTSTVRVTATSSTSTTTSTTSTTTIPVTTTTTTTIGVSVSKTQAVRSAASYLRYMSFSRSGLIRQLEFEGFSNEDATYGVDRQNADWYAQAAKTAASYLKTMSFSRSGLIRQLLFEGFSQAEAEYGVNSVGL